MLPTAFYRTIFPHTFQAADPAAEILPAFQREEKAASGKAFVISNDAFGRGI